MNDRGQTLIHRLSSAASTALRLLCDDPAHLFIQAARRLPPGVRVRLARLEPPQCVPATGQAALYTLADRRSEAIRALDRAPGSTLANALRISHGVFLPPSASARQRARQAWEVGDLPEAMRLAPPSSVLGRHLQAQQRILRSGSRLVPPSLATVEGVDPAPRSEYPTGIRVLHQLTNSLPHTQSGYALRSHQVLRALDAEGVGVGAITRIGYPAVIGRLTAPPTDQIDGIVYHRVLPRRVPADPDARLAAQAEHLAAHAAAFGADVLHTTTPYDNALVAEAAARALGIPWVYEMRGEMESTWLASRPAWAHAAAESWRYRAMRAKEAEMASRADAVVALSRVQQDSLVSRGVPGHRITVIGNAADVVSTARTLTPDEARGRLGLPAGRWVGTVSAVVDYEGLDTLIRAVRILRDEGVDVRAAIVGDGVALPDLRDLAAALDVADRIAFAGRVDPAEALDWYQALEILTIPRQDTAVTRAVTPIKGLQAMALGIPQVVSDLPALVEVGSADGQGLAVTPEDPAALAEAIRGLLGDQSRWAGMSRRALEVVQRHTWEHRAKQYVELYSRITRESGVWCG